LPADDQRRFCEAVVRNGMPRLADTPGMSKAERAAFRENVRFNRLRAKALAYESLPPGAARTAFLDSVIAERAKSSSSSRQRNRDDAARLKHRMESVGPGDRAAISQFMADLRARRAATKR
jgi:hypothetical protein